MHSLTLPGAVLFDFGDTLFDLSRRDMRAGLQAVLSLAQGDADVETAMAFYTGMDFLARRNAACMEVPAPQWLRLLFETLGLSPRVPYEQMETVLWDAAYACTPIPGARELLMTLKSEGVVCGVISNASFSGATLEYELSKHGLADPFAFVRSSADIGFRKPDILVYRLAWILSGVNAPREIWYVGDTFEHDVVGARSMGMQAVWYNPGKRPLPTGEHAVQVADMADLQARFFQLAKAAHAQSS